MNALAAEATATLSDEEFDALLNENLEEKTQIEGQVVQGKIVGLYNDLALVDVGLKSEGHISLKEFEDDGAELEVGDTVDVFVERIENNQGEAVLSREKAIREEAWERLEKAHEKEEHVEGRIFGRVKGGFTVDLGGAAAFLPGSQVDIRPVRDVGPLMNVPQPFVVLKMDRKRGNIVVSRRAVMEESRAEARKELLEQIREGQVLEGMVKNITDYGAFIDLGGVDGLLHVTDISWKRINHPSEMLKLGETVQVMVTKFNSETKRISLGMKQLESNPWDDIRVRFVPGTKVKGQVTNIADYGAFVGLDSGIEGLIHVSEMSWTRKNVDVSQILSIGQEIDVMVLEVDEEKHRISLGLKQCQENPWRHFAETYKPGNVIEGEIRNITDFGLFVDIGEGLEGLVHESDISWSEPPIEAMKNYNKGEKVEVKILDIDPEKERVALGIKQLSGEGEASAASEASDFAGLKRGQVVTCTVSAVKDGGIELTVSEGVTAFVKKTDLARERMEQRPDRFAVGDRVDAKVTTLDRKTGKVSLSIKALEVDAHKKAIEEYGSSDSGASLGDILGAAIQESKKAGAAEGGKDPKDETDGDSGAKA